MERDVNAWYAFYGPSIDGIFFDQGQNRCGPSGGSRDWSDTYRFMSAYVKGAHPGALTVINPGTAVPQCYERAADVLVTFEGSYAAYTGHPATPAEAYMRLTWNPVDPQKIWHLVYGAGTEAAMDDAVLLSKQRNAGWVYVTDDTLGNPWDSLPAPSYWTNERGQVAPSGWADASAPSVPGNVSLGNVAGSSVQIGWAPSTVTTPTVSAPVTGYDIYGNGTWVSSVKAGITAFRASGLHPSTAYELSVRARDAAGHQSDAGVVTATTQPAAATPPSAPDGLSLDGTDYTSTTLTWPAASPGDAAVVGYAVYQDGAKIMSLPASVTSLTVGGLTPGGQAARFTVTALDASGGESRPSPSATATTSSLPDGQGIESAQASQAQDTLTYTADFFEPFAYHRVFIATSTATTDPTPTATAGATTTATATPCWSTTTTPAICATYLIENAQLYRYTGTGTDWKWSPAGAVTPAVDGYTYTWTIPTSTLGSPPAETLVFQGEGYAPTATSPVLTPTQPTQPTHRHRRRPRRGWWND
jgi:hypothetical protein